MNENAKMWVNALRSGEFKQARFQLESQDGYCCLGVACVLYEKATGDELPRNVVGFLSEAFLAGKFEHVRTWLGLRGRKGEYGLYSLTQLNDSGRANFSEIASVIEAEAKELFVS